MADSNYTTEDYERMAAQTHPQILPGNVDYLGTLAGRAQTRYQEVQDYHEGQQKKFIGSLGATALATTVLEIQNAAFKYATETKVSWDGWNRYALAAGFTFAAFRGVRYWTQHRQVRGVVKAAKREYEQLNGFHQTAHARATEMNLL
jgi:hypothetical protein